MAEVADETFAVSVLDVFLHFFSFCNAHRTARTCKHGKSYSGCIVSSYSQILRRIVCTSRGWPVGLSD